MVLFSNNVDVKNDKLLFERVVRVKFSQNEESIHIVKAFEVSKGVHKEKKYYLFIHQEGKSIMNFDKDDYILLKQYVDITPQHAIFMIMDGEPIEKMVDVAESYRYE